MASRSTSIYEPQLQVPVAQMPELKSGNVGGAAAAAAGNVLHTYEKKLRQEGAAWAASTVTGLRNEYGQRLLEAEQSGMAGAGFADSIAREFAGRVEALRKEAPPYSTGIFDAGATDVFNEIGEAGRDIEDRTRSRQSESEAHVSIDNLTAHAARAPRLTLDAKAEADAVVRAINPRPEIRWRLEAKVQGIVTAGITALGKQDPDGLVRLFKSGEARGYIADPKVYQATHERAKIEARRSAAREAAKTASASTLAILDAQGQIGKIIDGASLVELRDPDAQAVGRDRSRHLKKKVDEAQTRVERDAEELEVVAGRLTSGKRLDATDAAHMRGGNALYKSYFVPSLDGLESDALRQRKIDFIALTGFVPDAAREEINAALRSGDPRRTADAAEFIHGLQEQDQSFVKAFDHADQRLVRGVWALKGAGFEAAEAVKRYSEGLQMKPDDAARRQQEFGRLVGISTMGEDAVRDIRSTFGLPDGGQVQLQDLLSPAENDDPDANRETRSALAAKSGGWFEGWWPWDEAAPSSQESSDPDESDWFGPIEGPYDGPNIWREGDKKGWTDPPPNPTIVSKQHPVDQKYQPGAWRSRTEPRSHLGKLLVDPMQLSEGQRANLFGRRWVKPTGQCAGNDRLSKGYGYFGAGRDDKTYHGALDFPGDDVQMPTDARLIAVTPEGGTAHTLTFDLGNGMQLSLHHVKPSKALMDYWSNTNGSGRFRRSGTISTGTALGVVDKNAADHVHLQIIGFGGSFNGTRLTQDARGGGFVVDPTQLFGC